MTTTECKPHGCCYLNVLCQRCGRCIGHCICPPPEQRATEKAYAKHKSLKESRRIMKQKGSPR